MVKVKYDWASGVKLEQHTRCKLDILREYFYQYLRVRVISSPNVRRFRIAIIDGFAGGGIYKDGTFGSPLIFLEELKKFSDEITIRRHDKKLPKLLIECLFIVNEIDPNANETLYNQLKIWVAANDIPKEHFNIEIQKFEKPFLDVYPKIRQTLWNRKFQNVLFNIDPYGYTQVDFTTLYDIINSFKNVEIFYTFMVGAFLQYLSLKDISSVEKKIEGLDISIQDYFQNEELRTKPEWLGGIEKIIHAEFSKVAKFVSPFAINQEGNTGYNYWLLHFSKHYRAREVYNDVLHKKAESQVHFGRFGLDMLKYTSGQDGIGLFDFSEMARKKSIEKLHSDIPKFISESDNGMLISDFKDKIYNNTPAHSDDINNVLIESQDIKVLTDKKHPRRSANTITNPDFIELNKQKSFYFFTPPNNKNKTD